MRTLAFPLALLLVIAAPIALVGLASLAETWGRWVVRFGGGVGVAGLVATAVVGVNLLLPRTCGDGSRNRPLLSIATEGGDCFRDGLGQLQAVGVVVVATSAWTFRRSARGGDGAAPAAPSR